MTQSSRTLDTSAAMTRSLLGWGVVAGPFYLVVGLVLAITRPGFDLSRHALSLLMLGDTGWLHRANVVLTALMVLAAAYGVIRAVRSGRGLAMGVLIGCYGVCLIASAVFGPDPVDGFPPGASASASVSGMLHLVFGALGFVSVAAAAFTFAAWCRSERIGGLAPVAVALGVLILVGFGAGAALSQSVVGVLLLWVAVLAIFGWLAIACVRLYQWTPHPVTGVRR